MHPQTVFTKTSKGVLEVKNKTIKLPRELSVVFLAVDGKSTFSDLVSKSGIPANKLEEGVNKLIADGYIRVFSSPVRTKDVPTQPKMVLAAMTANAPPPPPGARDEGEDLDFTSPSAMAKLNAEAVQRSKTQHNHPALQTR